MWSQPPSADHYFPNNNCTKRNTPNNVTGHSMHFIYMCFRWKYDCTVFGICYSYSYSYCVFLLLMTFYCWMPKIYVLVYMSHITHTQIQIKHIYAQLNEAIVQAWKKIHDSLFRLFTKWRKGVHIYKHVCRKPTINTSTMHAYEHVKVLFVHKLYSIFFFMLNIDSTL